MIAFARVAAFAAGLLVCSAAHAWGSAGHRTIGAIADALIAGTPAADAVQGILGSSLRRASVWADCAKGVTRSLDGSFAYVANPVYVECTPFETPGEQALMVDFVRRNWDACRPRRFDDPCHKQYHYTDVALQRDAYAASLAGTSDHDVVAAVNACIAVLQGKPAPVPFDIRDKREALRLLTHYVGDLHQPLHVVSIYLDRNGRAVDPDAGAFDPRTKTRGGNDLRVDGLPLHAQWDDVGPALAGERFVVSALPAARTVAPADAPVSQWAGLWATDTLASGKAAFSGLTYSAVDLQHRWSVLLPSGYGTTREALQRVQLVKAGARLAQLLVALFPAERSP